MFHTPYPHTLPGRVWGTQKGMYPGMVYSIPSIYSFVLVVYMSVHFTIPWAWAQGMESIPSVAEGTYPHTRVHTRVRNIIQDWH